MAEENAYSFPKYCGFFDIGKWDGYGSKLGTQNIGWFTTRNNQNQWLWESSIEFLIRRDNAINCFHKGTVNENDEKGAKPIPDTAGLKVAG